MPIPDWVNKWIEQLDDPAYNNEEEEKLPLLGNINFHNEHCGVPSGATNCTCDSRDDWE